MKRLFARRRVAWSCETLESRRLLTSESAAPLADMTAAETSCVASFAFAVEVEPQYRINHTPRLQPGNAPLIGTPAYRGTDQVDVLWQTLTIGTGQTDSFEVHYRPVTSSGSWQAVSLNAPLGTSIPARTIHSATITGLEWDADYEYRVQHLRAGEVLATYQHRFHTRLAPGDSQSFRFAAYGDSSSHPGSVPPRPESAFMDFQRVQTRINHMNPDFAILLGDNDQGSGSHNEFDARFDPVIHPGAAEWIASHVDYMAIGNHDGGNISHLPGQEHLRGQASRDNYSTPVSIAGVNAHASPPAVEFAEFNYSFDYGNTHFITLDFNAVDLLGDGIRQRIENLVDYAVADLNASQAQWKIAYFHHPIVGTEKPHDQPSGYFFQMVSTRLLEAGVDLVLVGHSHMYAWTHALTGFEDRDQNGIITDDEVTFVPDTDRTYSKSAGLIQVVAGVGGRSLRSYPFSEPFIASGYSGHDATGPIEYGFAHVEVTQDRLTVSYISAETGQIVGDTNGNGLADENEPFFGRFQIVDAAVARGDLNGDAALDAADIDLLAAALWVGDLDSRYDMNDDDVNDANDFDMMIESILGAPRGDANLDGVFNSSDLVSVFQVGKYENPQAGTASWAEGDWNGDGLFTSIDLVLVFQLGTYRG